MPTSVTRFLADHFAENGGQLSFERYMQLALYHPDFGYYASNIQAVGGQRSDFTTAAELSPLLAQSISAWILRERDSSPLLKNARPLHVIEVGCGDGSLAHDILRTWSWWKRRRIRYHLVETSAPLLQRQQQKLQAFRKHCYWHQDMPSALSSASGHALIFSNELIDAFPATAIRWHAANQQWQEIHLRFDPESGLREVFVPLSHDQIKRLAPHFSILNSNSKNLPDGTRREFHRSARDWMQSWSDSLQHGSILTIDYGAAIDHLYHRRPEGSLRAYYRHQCLRGAAIYQRFGKQDLTADVNFTDLEIWGEHCGFKNIRLESLHHFTQRHQLQNKIPGKAHSDVTAPAPPSHAHSIQDPDGSGSAFQVLLQHKI
ncbi:MAG: SAM-dependent methyltransferase [Verrucomicrobiales bacterium]|nr:SAM-dependent methyltransferase [Verrucomicrobiales bacterium]